VIQVFGSAVGEEELRELAACIDRSWLGMGARVEQFEKEFAERLGLPNFLMLDSGSNALYLAVRLLDLPPGSEIILPSFTWVGCAHAIRLNGHRPVFCDVEITTQNVTRETIRPHVTPRTAAIMVVHYAGRPVDLEPVRELGLPIIEDAAHAVDSTYGGKACGSLGAVGVFSFDAVKNLTTGSGGGLTCRDPERLDMARRLRYCGIGKSGYETASRSRGGSARWWESEIHGTFVKAVPSDLNAAIGLAQLRKIDALQERRAEIWDRYQHAFADSELVESPEDAAVDQTHSYFTYLIRVDARYRDRLAGHLLDHGIYSTLRFHPLHLSPIFGPRQELPLTETLSECGLNIPLHPRLTDEDVERVIQTIMTFLAKSRGAPGRRPARSPDRW